MAPRSIPVLLLALALTAGPAGAYTGRKLTCRQIGSYDRAQELLRQGHSYLDRNGDGTACESLR